MTQLSAAGYLEGSAPGSSPITWRLMEPGSAVDAEAVLEAVATPQWLIVACDGRGFAIALERVSAIVPPRPYTRIPGCGPQVCGLAGVRGRVVTVFDLGAALGGTPSLAAADHRLLLVDHGDRRIGLVVNEVRLAAGMQLTPVARDAGIDVTEVLGMGTIDGVSVLALDTDRLFERLLD